MLNFDQTLNNYVLCYFSFISDLPKNEPTYQIDPELVNKIQSLRDRLRDAEFQNSARSQELFSLKTQLSKMVAEKSTGHRTSKQYDSFKNSSRIFFENHEVLRVPSIYNFMPHLMDSPVSLKPALHVSKDREGGRCI